MSEKDSAEKEETILWEKSYCYHCKGNTLNGEEQSV